MAFGSFLKKIFAPAAAVAAAPFTAGTSLAWLPAAIGAGGAALSGASQASAQNRGSRIQALMAQDVARLRAEQERRESERDIMRKLAQTAYIGSGGYQAPASPRTITLGGAQMALPSFGFGPRGSSEAEISAAKSLEAELLKRLAGPGWQPSDYMKHAKAGKLESLGGWLGAGLGAYGGFAQDYQNRRTIPSGVPSNRPWTGSIRSTYPDVE